MDQSIAGAVLLQRLSPALRRGLRAADQVDVKSCEMVLHTFAYWLDTQDAECGRRVDELVAAMTAADAASRK